VFPSAHRDDMGPSPGWKPGFGILEKEPDC
jgi:hypothetical protein